MCISDLPGYSLRSGGRLARFRNPDELTYRRLLRCRTRSGNRRRGSGTSKARPCTIPSLPAVVEVRDPGHRPPRSRARAADVHPAYLGAWPASYLSPRRVRPGTFWRRCRWRLTTGARVSWPTRPLNPSPHRRVTWYRNEGPVKAGQGSRLISLRPPTTVECFQPP